MTYNKTKCVNTKFKKYLQFLSLEDQLLEIDLFIDDLNNGKYAYTNIKRKYNRIQQLKKLRHNILLSQYPLFFYHK